MKTDTLEEIEEVVATGNGTEIEALRGETQDVMMTIGPLEEKIGTSSMTEKEQVVALVVGVEEVVVLLAEVQDKIAAMTALLHSRDEIVENLPLHHPKRKNLLPI